MNCRRIRPLLPALLEFPDASPSCAAPADDHLLRCASCRRRLQVLRRHAAALQAYGRDQERDRAPDLLAGILERLPE